MSLILFLQISTEAASFISDNISDTANKSIGNSVLVDVTNTTHGNENVILVEDLTSSLQSNNTVECLVQNKEIQPVEVHTEQSKLCIKTVQFNLQEILSHTAYGNSLLLINKHGGQITTQCQSILCDLIISYFLNLNIR